MKALSLLVSLFSLSLCSAELPRSFNPERLNDGDCSSAWEEYSSKPNKEIALPDTNVTYWRYRFEIKKNIPVSFKITGQFPHSRYMAFTIYRQDSMDIVSNITDVNVEADPNHLNPFLPKVPRDVPNRSYSISVLPFGAKQAKNAVTLPEVSANEEAVPVDIWYRIYLPDQKAYPNGAVALPAIQAFNPQTGEKIACPDRKALPFAPWKWVGKLPPVSEKGKLIFFKPKANAIYSNKDTSYIAARPISFKEEEVAVFKFRAPKTPETYQGGGEFTGDEEIRYWSMCYSSLLTTTAACFSDGSLKHKNDGRVTLVVATDDMKEAAEKKGYEFLSKGYNLFPVFLYRNLLSKESFAGHLAKIPNFPGEGVAQPEEYKAKNFIGEYAPDGVICSKEEFVATGCTR